MLMLKWILAVSMGLGLAQDALATILDATTKSIEVVTTTTAPLHYSSSWADHTPTTFVPGNTVGIISTATTTTITAAPGASTQRQIKTITIRNASTTASNVVTLQLDSSGVNHELAKRTLAAGESLEFDSNERVTVYDQNMRAITGLEQTTNLAGRTYAFQKAGGAKDAAGYWYSTWKDQGFPGAFSLGSPGLNGFTTDCSIPSQATDPVGAAQMGAHVLQDPASGGLYLRSAVIGGGQAELSQLIDIVWYNTGAVVTTTTAQSVTMPTLPPRDLNGSNNGYGWYAALYTTTANTNAGTIPNTTISYTNELGVAGRTGTFSAVVGWQAPATPVIGTWMPFALQAGDNGIRSIQSLTLGTSYAAGALTLVLYRPLATIAGTAANISALVDFGNPGIRVYNNSCIVALQVGASAASNLSGSYTIVER